MGAQHDTPEYRRIRDALKRMNQQTDMVCAQPICVMPNRVIHRGDPFDTAHDDAGLAVIGPAHPRCNRHEAGKKRHRPTQPNNWIM
jgi:hypothetical protein